VERGLGQSVPTVPAGTKAIAEIFDDRAGAAISRRRSQGRPEARQQMIKPSESSNPVAKRSSPSELAAGPSPEAGTSSKL
jgi:hypothetical protein